MLYTVDPDHLASVCPDEPPYRARQLREWLYRHPVLETQQMTNLPGSLRDRLELWPFELEADQSADGGRTRKWLFRTSDGAAIEAVLMGYPDRTTLCISSQAGCAMACTFCATGQFGFERHLEAGEITAQVAFAKAFLDEYGMPNSPHRLTNVVFMGMGEPLANYNHVRESLHRMIDLMGMSARAITVSTVGFVPGMRRLADEPWKVNLAVSLHAADDELRSSLVPLNERYSLTDVIEASRHYFKVKGRRISIEWTLIDGTNDSVDQARKLAEIAHDLRAHVNVIALNPTPLSADLPPSADRVAVFMDELRYEGVNATLRDTRGQDIDAACGQLRVHSEGTPIRIDRAVLEAR
ncbi:MAG: 23S rRNA (adenine(2503)-C(2))-methyltransferase RlmN [Acidimicrobiia bacterium]|nr:23S rRNA (adenine(2503)-C(2))-methyltransferase RlmN [Acidimicrobiia bacterium]